MRRLLFALLLAGLTARLASAEPRVEKARARPRAKAAADAADADADRKAREALAVIDGTAWVDDRASHTRGAQKSITTARAADNRVDADLSDARAIARGLQPWRATILERGGHGDGGGDRRGERGGGLDGASGSLAGAERLEPGDGYYLRRPTRAYGAPYVVEYVRSAVAEVRALYTDLPPLAIGDLSAEHGGALPGHVSHRSGRDVDIGFYFHHVPRGFEDAGTDLDLDATWALLAAFARTADHRDGVQIIFLDYAVQKRLYDFAKARGTPDDELAFLFQYPAGKDAMTGLVRHWPNHANHFHVRFKRTLTRRSPSASRARTAASRRRARTAAPSARSPTASRPPRRAS